MGFMRPLLLCLSVAMSAAAAVILPPPLLSPLPGLIPSVHGGSLRAPETAWAFTDRGRPVRLLRYLDRPAPTPTMLAEEDSWLQTLGLSARVIRTATACGDYACHDWVFTGGRYALDGMETEVILEENGYQRVASPRPGDLAIYRRGETGGIMHTGLVRLSGRGTEIMVESKWSWLGRYLHPASVYHCPDAVCLFYRSKRIGHLLQGINDSSGPHPQEHLALSPRLRGLPHGGADVRQRKAHAHFRRQDAGPNQLADLTE
jgi:hypothetical protein